MYELTRSRLLAFERPRIVRLRPNLFAACFQLMKLLPARFMLDRAEDAGFLHPGGHIVETTSGTFGMALAMLAAVRDYRLSIVTASSLIDRDFAGRLTSLGATLTITNDPEGSGNQQLRLDKLAQIRASDPNSFWPNQYDNPNNSLAYAAIADDLIRAVGLIDCLVASVGSGGSISGTGSFLRSAHARMRIIAVDTHGSVLFGQAPAPRKLRGMGNSIVPKNLRHDLVDEVHWIGAEMAINAAFYLYRSEGLFVGPTSGAAFMAADWYSRAHPNEKVVFLLPDEGHRYNAVFAPLSSDATQSSRSHADPNGPVLVDRVVNGRETDWLRFGWGRRTLETVISNG